jgi:hypothetical protein
MNTPERDGDHHSGVRVYCSESGCHTPTTLPVQINSAVEARFGGPSHSPRPLGRGPAVAYCAEPFQWFTKCRAKTSTMDIKESDWRTFRKLRELALDRYCQRVLEDVQRVLENRDGSNHDRYLKLWAILQDRDETIAIAFNDPRRSTAFIQLANIVAEDLLSKPELNQFSEDLRERIDAIKRLRNS